MLEPERAQRDDCNDNNACTQTSTCQTGMCTGANPVVCMASDQCHVAGTCNPTSGLLEPGGAERDDVHRQRTRARTETTCQGGACTGGTPVTCTAGPCRSAGTCNPATGCPTAGNQPNGTACNDSNACTTDDACNEGNCEGGPAFTCRPPDTCHNAGTCDISRPLPVPPSMQDLLGWWKLDGDGEDATPGNHDLENEGAVPVPGRSGMAMRFDGTSCMTTPIWEGATPEWDEARMQGASGVTVMAWINPDVYLCDPGFDQNAIAGRGWDYSIGSLCLSNVPSDYGQGATAHIRPANPVGWGYGGAHGSGLGWHHLAMTWDHQTMYTFLDGKAIGQMSIPGDNSDFDPRFAVGCMTSRYFTGDERVHQFHGAIDEVMLYRRALSFEEISTYYADADPCLHDAFADGTSCSDNNLCTQTDTCSSGTCVGGAPVVCLAPDPCHDAATCVSWAGCVNPPLKPDGTTCNDGAVCTQSETCQAGSCQASNAFPTVLNLPATDVGTLPGGTQVFAEDINASGQIVGGARDANGQYRAYMRTGTAPMAALPITPPSFGAALNDAGVVTGTITLPNESHAFRYSVTGGLQDLGRGGDGSIGMDGPIPLQGAYASDINASNQVAGTFTDEGEIRGFRYSDGADFEDIGSLEGGMTRAWGIDDSGTVVGSSWVDGSPATGIRRLGHAVMFNDAMVGLVDLKNIKDDPNEDWTLITANAIAGDYVIGIGDHLGKVSAFRLHLSTGVVDDLSGGWGGSTYAYGLNAAGDVGGWGSPTADDSGQAAFVYTDQLGFKKLNDMIEPASGWDLRSVSGISAPARSWAGATTTASSAGSICACPRGRRRPARRTACAAAATATRSACTRTELSRFRRGTSWRCSASTTRRRPACSRQSTRYTSGTRLGSRSPRRQRTFRRAHTPARIYRGLMPTSRSRGP